MECMERMDQKGLNQKVAAALEECEGRRVVDVSAEYLSFSAMNPYSLYYVEEKNLLLIGD